MLLAMMASQLSVCVQTQVQLVKCLQNSGQQRQEDPQIQAQLGQLSKLLSQNINKRGGNAAQCEGSEFNPPYQKSKRIPPGTKSQTKATPGQPVIGAVQSQCS